MKAHAKLMQSLNGNAPKAPHKRSKTWQAAHPVSSGIVPITDYVPPTGSYHPSQRVAQTNARFVRQALQVLTA